MLPLVDDSDLREKTERIISTPPELVVISTGIGFRGWLDATDGWDQGRSARSTRGPHIVARAPEARSAIRGARLREV